MNTWPGGKRHAISQLAHESWNASHYPGTRQLCCRCDIPTERCEEDAIYIDDIGPLCIECYESAKER